LTADEYLQSVLSKYYVNTSSSSTACQVAQKIPTLIKEWHKGYLNEIKFSGSYAKGTAIKGNTDVDLFISLKSSTPAPLKEIYDTLFNFLYRKLLNPQKRNASINLVLDSTSIDLIPAKQQEGYQNYHSIWLNRQNTWNQTNVDMHINQVVQSGRLDEIKLTKIWRKIHGLEFPSFYLELVVIDALKGKLKNQLADNFWSVLVYLRDNFKNVKFEDPSNTNNIISEDLKDYEKQLIANEASNSRLQKRWESIIW